MFVIFKDSVSGLSKPSFDQIQNIADSANVFVNNSVLPVVNEAAENLVVSQTFAFYFSFIFALLFLLLFLYTINGTKRQLKQLVYFGTF